LARDSHQDLVRRIREQLAVIFEESDQSIYVYLDDANKVCNKRFASLLGYSSPSQWAAVKENFPEAFVTPGDRRTLVSAYQNAVNSLVGSTIPVKWKKKGGGEVATTTILVPIVLDGHRMALHFITPS
jgi:carbohydrate-binding DOMON domain-containing protein